MKRIPLAAFLLLTIISSGRGLTIDPPTGLRHAISLSSEYFFASNAINNRFALGYFKGEFIDDVRKNSVSDKLSANNRFGAGFNTELKYTQLNDTIFNLPRSFYSVSLSSHFHFNCLFSKDVFELFFRGNKGYAGKTAELGGFNYNQLVYQQVNFTFGHSYKRETNKFNYTIGLSLNKGQKLYRIQAPAATIYTAESGEYLDLGANLQIHQSDSSKNKTISWNGTGASLDFSFSWKDQKNNSLNISAQNFGFIQWNNQTAIVKADTSFRFEGVDVSDLFIFSDSVKEIISLDSSFVEPYLSGREKKSYATPLPALLSVSYMRYLKPEKIDIQAGVNYLFFADYQLKETVSIGYTYNHTQRFSVIASYGGFSGFQAGISYDVLILKRWMLGIESNYLSSMFNQSKGCAQGAFVSLSAYF